MAPGALTSNLKLKLFMPQELKQALLWAFTTTKRALSWYLQHLSTRCTNSEGLLAATTHHLSQSIQVAFKFTRHSTTLTQSQQTVVSFKTILATENLSHTRLLMWLTWVSTRSQYLVQTYAHKLHSHTSWKSKKDAWRLHHSLRVLSRSLMVEPHLSTQSQEMLFITRLHNFQSNR